MNRKLIFATIITGAAVAACSHHDKKADLAGSEIETIDVALPMTDSVSLTQSYPGYLTAKATVDVMGRVNGQLLAQLYTIGQTVGKGAVLFRIEDTSYREALAQAQASLATARSERDYAASHYEAVKKALESDAVSKMEVIQAESALRQAEAAIKNAEAAVATARLNLSYCTVTAPVGGEVTANVYDVGNYIPGEGSPVKLATIYDNSTMTANFSIDDERFISLLRERGRKDAPDLSHVRLMFSDSVPHEYFGDLSYVAPAMNKQTGTIELKCSVPNTYGELRSGMYVSVSLPYGNLADAILVKDASVSTDQLGKYLYVVNDSNKVVYTPVKTGPVVRDSMRVILSGMKADDRYVTKALLKVRDGMTVKPQLVK